MSKINQMFPDHAAMIRDPGQWPKWPLLPVVNRKPVGMPDGGVLIAGDPTNTVYRINLWSVPSGVVKDTIVNNPDIPRTTYDSIEAMLQAGWEVD